MIIKQGALFIKIKDYLDDNTLLLIKNNKIKNVVLNFNQISNLNKKSINLINLINDYLLLNNGSLYICNNKINIPKYLVNKQTHDIYSALQIIGESYGK